LELPRQSDIAAYYRQLAPQRVTLSQAPQPSGTPRFIPLDISWPPSDPQSAAIADILPIGGLDELESSDPDSHEEGSIFVCCDMGLGAISWISLGGKQARIERSEGSGFPCHIVRTDLDGNGQPDYVVADLGSYLPEDHDRGRVVWLRQSASEDAAALEETVLLDGVGRVADAQPADIDGDGDLDLIVAVFGWHTTGGIILLRQQDRRAGQLHFEPEVLDERPGTIHVPVADLNADGQLDFVALISQEHESVEAFLNDATGKFTRQVLFRAPDPSFGSSGIDLVDLNSDGRLDVLLTNGDTFDSPYLKTSHGVRWIENEGDSWREHLLASLPGVHCARAGDFDLDGDLDVAASCFVDPAALANQPELTRLASLIWLEQRDGQFMRHEIAAGQCAYAAMELADVNRDGALDIVAGHFGDGAQSRSQPLQVWLNQGRAE
jgi:hypothetical protein